LLPFYLGKFAWSGAAGVDRAQFSSDLGELTQALANIRKFFTMLGVVIILLVIFFIVSSVLGVVVGGSEMAEAMRRAG
jgi:amino acid transporter